MNDEREAALRSNPNATEGEILAFTCGAAWMLAKMQAEFHITPKTVPSHYSPQEPKP